jgi:hypothetical protein
MRRHSGGGGYRPTTLFDDVAWTRKWATRENVHESHDTQDGRMEEEDSSGRLWNR